MTGYALAQRYFILFSLIGYHRHCSILQACRWYYKYFLLLDFSQSNDDIWYMSHGYWSVLATRWLQIILVDRASVGKRRAEAKYFVKVDLHWFLNSIDLLSWTNWRENGNHIPGKFFAWNCTHRPASKFTIGSDKLARQIQRIAFTCFPGMIR